MRLNTRIARLEKANASPPKDCPECGLPLDGTWPADCDLVITPPEIGDFTRPAPPVDTTQDICPTCGRRFVFRIPSPQPASMAVRAM